MYKSTKELEDNSILIDSEEAANKATAWVWDGRTVYCIGRNSLGVIINYHPPVEQPDQVEDKDARIADLEVLKGRLTTAHLKDCKAYSDIVEGQKLRIAELEEALQSILDKRPELDAIMGAAIAGLEGTTEPSCANDDDMQTIPVGG